MLDDTFVVQTNQGSTGASAPVASFNVTLGTAATDGNSFIVVVAHLDPNRLVLSPDNTIWLTVNNVASVAPVPALMIKALQAIGGGTSFTFTIDGVGDIACWWIAEISGLATMNTALDAAGTATNLPVGEDVGVASAGTLSASGTACNTQNVGFINPNGDDIVISTGCNRIASGTPPAISTVADTTAGQPGTWARMGLTVATSRVGNPNIRLDVFRKYTGGVQHLLDATYTWASTVAGGAAMIDAFRADIKPPEQTPGRAATNSTM